MSYDPELDLVFYGVGNPSPYNRSNAQATNKWSSSVLARRPLDGSLVWAYQFTPHDNWDYDAAATLIVADVKIDGHTRKALVTFTRTASSTRWTARPAKYCGPLVRTRDLGEECQSEGRADRSWIRQS